MPAWPGPLAATQLMDDVSKYPKSLFYVNMPRRVCGVSPVVMEPIEHRQFIEIKYSESRLGLDSNPNGCIRLSQHSGLLCHVGLNTDVLAVEVDEEGIARTGRQGTKERA